MRCVSDPDMASIMLDATIVRAHACATGYGKDTQEKEALGHRKGGFTTKIHACVDALGNPIQFMLTPGQRHDITHAQGLIEGIERTIVIAEKRYDHNTFHKSLCISGTTMRELIEKI